MRKLITLSAMAAVIGAAMIFNAYSANIARYTGTDCVEAATIQNCLNRTLNSVNAGVSGMLNANLTAVATGAGTAEQTLQNFVMPASTITTNAWALTIKCWGVTGATANNKTRKLYFGASVITTATEAANAQNWFLELNVLRTAAATQSVFGRGLAGTAGVTPVSYVNQGTDDFATALTIKCTGTDGTNAAGDITANGMTVEVSR